jgi:hypothetical protein
MMRLVGFAVGVLAFLAAHGIQVLEWNAWFGGVHEPWFLNAGRAIALTLASVGVASLIVAVRNASARKVRGISIAAGAFVAMTAVLFLKPGGPGTIFPMVMASGGLLILAASTLGAWLGRATRRVLNGR